MGLGGRSSRWRAAAVLVLSAVLFGAGPQSLPAAAETPEAAPGQIVVSPRDTVAVASWAPVASAGYVVETATGPDFLQATTTDVASELAVLSPLEPSTTYWVRVSARSGDGARGPASAAVSFTTSERRYAMPAPTVTLDSLTSTSITPSWTAPADDLRYEVQLGKDESFTRPSPTTRLVESTSTTFDELTVGTTYTVRVRVVDATGAALSAWSVTASRKPAEELPLRVGSFNVKKSTQANWPKRRLAVAAAIRDEELDVVGLQEATPHRVKGGWRQYEDVVRLLGSDWALTDGVGGGPGEARTIYNRTKLTMIDHGYRTLSGSTRFGVPRYAAWAIFEQRNTGKRFVFVNTHFAYQKTAAATRWRTSAAKQMVELVDSINTDKLPVIIGGDFNTGAPRNSSNGVYRTFTGAGYIDPLARTGELGAAKKLTQAHLRTVNSLSRKAPMNPNRNVIDMLLVTPMRVAEWETVARLDGSGRFVGTIPSDHNLIKITAYLP
jgi:endonuclease/exonuclease/phosphatase family metal-dependent hydrolase